jgi:hypothetical protein
LAWYLAATRLPSDLCIDGTAIGRAKLPSTSPAAFSQADLKKRKLLHRYRLSLLSATGSNVHEKGFERRNDRE